MLFKLLYRHILKIHKNIKSNCFLQTPPDSCSASPQVPLGGFPCCFTVSSFNNCIPKSRKMLFKLLYRHILKIHKTIRCMVQVHPLIRFLLRSRVDEKSADLHKAVHLCFVPGWRNGAISGVPLISDSPRHFN